MCSPLSHLCKNCNLVSYSSVGDKKKGYSFDSLKGWSVRYEVEKNHRLCNLHILLFHYFTSIFPFVLVN